MVKTLELTQTIPGLSARALFDLLYGGDAFLRAYHQALNGDPDAQVGDWNGDERTVHFRTPVDAPAFIKRLVGKDVMQVVEIERRALKPDGTIQLVSLPVPDMPGGSKFQTQATFTFKDAPGSCHLHCQIVCTASGPYGLTGAIESFMAEASKKSLGEFLEFIPQYMQQVPGAALGAAAAAAAAPAPAAPAPAVLPPRAAVAPVAAGAAAAAEPETFYDAPELPLPVFPVAVAAGAGEALRFEDAALLYLRYQCRTGDQIVGLLQALELQVHSLQEKVSALQAAAEARARHRRWLPELPETVSTRQALLGAALLASATAAAAMLYGRQQALAAR